MSDESNVTSAAALSRAINSRAHFASHETAAVNFIKDHIRQHSLKNIAFSFNGGKDCTVLLHLLRVAIYELYEQEDSLEGVLTLYFPDDDEFQEVLDFMDNMATQYKFKIISEPGSFKTALTRLCDENTITAIFMGQRGIDPGAKHLDKAARSDVDKGWADFMRLNPLLDWTYQQVWHFLRDLELPYCNLYDQGFTSLGARFNTQRNPALLQDDGTYLAAYHLKDADLERAGRYVSDSKQDKPELHRSSSRLSDPAMSQKLPDIPSTIPSSSSSSSSLPSSSPVSPAIQVQSSNSNL